MNDDELVAFNPILEKAVIEIEKGTSPSAEYWGQAVKDLRPTVAVFVRAGIPPEKIYAMIKTGRMLTHENMKVLTKSDIKEWDNPTGEYLQVAAPFDSATRKPAISRGNRHSSRRARVKEKGSPQ